MCSGKYIDIYFIMKITYPITRYLNTYMARFVPFTWMAGCAVAISKEEHNREQGHKDNTNTSMGCDARASTQEEC